MDPQLLVEAWKDIGPDQAALFLHFFGGGKLKDVYLQLFACD